MAFCHRTLVMAAALVLGSAFAAVPPPQDPVGDTISWPQISKSPPATELRLGTLQVQLEKTTLRTIQASAKGTISHRGDAAGSFFWLCYALPHQRVWVLSHGEMGGPEHEVTEINAEKVKGQGSAANCPDLPQNLQPISLHGGIWIGSSQESVIKALGPPSYTKGQWQSFNYDGKVKGHCPPDGYDLTNWMLIKIHLGRVVAIKAGQVTSC